VFEPVAGVPGGSGGLVCGVCGKDSDGLAQQRGGPEPSDGVAGCPAAQGINRPALAERCRKRDEQDDTKEAVCAVEYQRIPAVQREQQGEREQPNESRPVADDERDGKQARDQKERLLDPGRARDGVYRGVAVGRVREFECIERIDPLIRVEHLQILGAPEEVVEYGAPEEYSKGCERPAVDCDTREHAPPEPPVAAQCCPNCVDSCPHLAHSAGTQL
jgi:hypothetical protein